MKSIDQGFKEVATRLTTPTRESGAAKQHPSLSAPLELPPPLRPQQAMDRNAPCWCGSGVKWKKCHRDRHLQKPVNFGRMLHDLLQSFKIGFCSHPDAGETTCSGAAIRAHTIQRRGGLSAIAEAGHVLSFKEGLQNRVKNRGRLIPEKVGLREASTFRGFCPTHDEEMFRPAEKGSVTLDKNTAFLLSFRAVAYEHFTKAGAARNFEVLRQRDRGLPFEKQCEVQENIQLYKFGTLKGLRDIEKWKAGFDTAYMTEDLSGFRFLCVAFAGILPITACGAIFPEFDFRGKALQDIGTGNDCPENLAFNLTVLDGRSVVVIGWKDSEHDVVKDFVNSFLDLQDDEKANAFVRFSFEFLENTYSDPRWWRSLSEENREAIAERVLSSANIHLERSANCLVPDGRDLVANLPIKETLQL